MKPGQINILYWVTLILLTIFLLLSAVPSVLKLSYALDYFTNHLGYPEYMLFFTGLMKILGLIALFIPGYARLKEWVFAGLTFDLIGAIYSNLSVDPFPAAIAIIVDLLLLAVLYILHHKKLKLSLVNKNIH